VSIVPYAILTEISRNIPETLQVYCRIMPPLGYNYFFPSTLLNIFYHSPQPSTLHILLYC